MSLERRTDRFRPSKLSGWAIAGIGIAALASGGCSTVPRTPYSQAEARTAQPVGYDDANIRVWLDGKVPNPQEFAPKLARGQRTTYLALSGGGGNGAYGAGILNGWTKSGARPTFTAVSGVSTGALIAPFAFLGASYDATLTSIYTDGKAEGLVQAPNFIDAAFGSSLFGSGRLLNLVSSYVDADLVAAIAREHRAGRRLYVVTTNLDSKRGVVWNVGAIAVSGRPDSIDLIRKVLAASASVPLAFSPVLIDAAATDGHAFQEMHADGNVTTAVFTLPLEYLSGGRQTPLTGGKIFILMNTSIEPKFAVVDDQSLKIVGASIATLTTQKTLVDLAATYAYAQTNHVDFNLTAIDPRDDAGGTKSFDTAYMKRLYTLGFETATSGNFWRKSPPGVPGGDKPRRASARVTAAR